MCKNFEKCKGRMTEEADPIVAAVREDLLSRSQIGIKKYGTTLAREDVDLEGWLTHAYEETLDQANYLKAAILKIQQEKNQEFNTDERIG